MTTEQYAAMAFLCLWFVCGATCQASEDDFVGKFVCFFIGGFLCALALAIIIFAGAALVMTAAGVK